MCTDMIELKKAKTRIMELEEELKATRKDYMEEIVALVEKNDDLIKKIGVFMGDPAPGGEDDDSTCPDNYIIIDDPTQTPVKMTLLMKLEQISWSLRPIKITSRPP